jgi:hypothetical protein
MAKGYTNAAHDEAFLSAARNEPFEIIIRIGDT